VVLALRRDGTVMTAGLFQLAFLLGQIHIQRAQRSKKGVDCPA
jgi:hypothetical protein